MLHFKTIGTVTVLLAALGAQAAWAAGCPPNLIPMYEGVKKNAAMIEADEKFKAFNAEMGHTPEEGARIGADLGWRYFLRDGDPATAMKRFNQAWLLDPKNGDAYHGMAVMSLILSENPAFAACPFTSARADALFQKALQDPNITPGTYADYGRFLVVEGRFEDAIAPLRTALANGPQHSQAMLHLAVALANTDALPEACDWMKKAVEALPDIPRNAADEICALAGQN